MSSGMPTSGRVSVLDRPNSYIGRSVPRPNARRLLHGRGQFVDDIVLPRIAHVAFWRSPFAHSRIKRIDSDAAARSPGVIRVVTGAEIAEICRPWVGVLAHLQGIKSAPQYPLAMERACWQGEAVAAVVASTRRAAEDALERLAVDLEELPPVTDMASALDPDTPVIHPELGDNLTFEIQKLARRRDPTPGAARRTCVTSPVAAARSPSRRPSRS